MILVDLTHTLDQSTPVYPKSGDMPVQISQITSVDKDHYASFGITMGMHVGTHIDTPAHMLTGKSMIDALPLERLCCLAQIIDARRHDMIDVSMVENISCRPGSALLICTGYDAYYGQEKYFAQHPVMTKECADKIIEKKLGMIGLDTPSPDRFPFAIHKHLFAYDILILENLTNLDKLLQARSIMLYVLPLKCATDAAPARVIAAIE